MNKIIALRSGALGDCVVSYPALRLLREHYPNAHITVICDPYSGPILEGSGYVDRVLLMAHKGRKLAYLWDLLRLRKEKFDLLIDFQLSGRSIFQVALTGAKRRLGLDKKHWTTRMFYTDLGEYDYSVPAAKRIADTMKPLGIEATPDDLWVRVQTEERHRKDAKRLLDKSGVTKPYVILQTTTGDREEFRRWPTERFAAVADHLTGLGYSVVITSLGNSEAVNAVIEKASLPIHNLVGSTDLMGLAALLEGASLYVGYQTGPMHLAGAMGTPIVALFDVPNYEFQWKPMSSAPVRMLQSKEHPEPPGWRMDTVGEDEVIAAIDDILEEVGTPDTQVLSVAGRC
jgi:ADP-heptose:LPS heptosyltransferase